jgi:nicotinate-nucleotide pyrophosphorylase (carboxylating)
MRTLHTEAMQTLVRAALQEDIGVRGDVTTLALVEKNQMGSARLVTRERCRVSGVAVAEEVFRQLDPDIKIVEHIHDGEDAEADDVVLSLEGQARAILTGERTALNFMQRMCGIATLTATYVGRVQPHAVRVLDTRKTTPLLRHLEKYAVVCGGGTNHRTGLYDRVMIKDNHAAFWQSKGGGDLAAAVKRARACYPDMTLEVEIDRVDQLEPVLEAGPDWILLDNMTPDDVRMCVQQCRGRAKLEVSGGITLDTIAAYADCGVDAISVGALTHAARAVDLALDWETQP